MRDRCGIEHRDVLPGLKESGLRGGGTGWCVHSRTAPSAARWYIHFMHFTLARVTLAAWIALVCVVGLLTGAVSVLHWVALASLAVIPSVLACTLSRASSRTLSPRVQAIRR